VAIPIRLKETDDNTGIFLADLLKNKIEIVPTTQLPFRLTSGIPQNAGNIVPGKMVLGSDNKIYVLASAISGEEDLTIT